jgi:hypothetical protein
MGRSIRPVYVKPAPPALEPEAVDLGLPSGLKWASFNVGANSPEEYGNYYAWGETQPKSDYSWSTHQWCNGDFDKLTKYCPSDMIKYWDGSGLPDNKTVLDLDDDTASVNWDGSWRMPTDAEWAELRENSTWIWTDNYSGTGIAGKVLTASNGSSIFLPAAGGRYGTDLRGVGSEGYYWSSSLTTDPGGACSVHFNSGSVYGGKGYGRCYGFSVRPVCPKD